MLVVKLAFTICDPRSVVAWEIRMIWLLTGLLVIALIVTSLRASVWLFSRGLYNSD